MPVEMPPPPPALRWVFGGATTMLWSLPSPPPLTGRGREHKLSYLDLSMAVLELSRHVRVSEGGGLLPSVTLEPQMVREPDR